MHCNFQNPSEISVNVCDNYYDDDGGVMVVVEMMKR